MCVSNGYYKGFRRSRERLRRNAPYWHGHRNVTARGMSCPERCHAPQRSHAPKECHAPQRSHAPKGCHALRDVRPPAKCHYRSVGAPSSVRDRTDGSAIGRYDINGHYPENRCCWAAPLHVSAMPALPHLWVRAAALDIASLVAASAKFLSMRENCLKRRLWLARRRWPQTSLSAG